MALSVVTTPSGTVRLISQNISKVTNVIQGTSLWENDGVTNIKPKGNKVVGEAYLELGGKVDKVSGKGLSTEDFTTAEKTKLTDLPLNADLTLALADKVDVVSGKELSDNNYTDAEVLLVADVPNKVDKISGKGLSTNDFTDDLETKAGLISSSGTGDKYLANDGAYKKVSPQTGFIPQDDVIVNYDPTTRVITLTGSFTAYYDGVAVPALVTGWASSPHADASGTYFLYYDGTFHFDVNPWTFDVLVIASVTYTATNRFSLRETHGAGMNADTHEELHNTIGCYKTAGGDFSDWIANSTTAVDRRPLISETTIKDEDLRTVLPALSTEIYARRYLSGTNTRNFEIDQADIISTTGGVPNWNSFSVTWGQTPFTNNQYGAIFVAAIPVTSDAGSQKYRYIFVQPQTVSTTLSVIQALTPSSLTLGDPATLVAEYCFIGKIIVRASTTNWTITSVEKLEGTKIAQIAITSSPPSASSVSYTPTGNISATDVQSAITELDTEKMIANTAITGATKTKITYDAKGLVTAGADATTADISDSTDKRYVTDAQKSALHDAITVTDTNSIDFTLTGQALTASAKFGTTAGTVCDGADTRLSDARTPIAHNQAETTISFTDVTTNNSSATKHGFLPKLDGLTTTYLRGDGSWATPSGSGGVTDGDKGDIVVSGSGATWTLDDSFKTATAGSNGDFYITSAITLATNDIVRISFPSATNGASNARLSVDGGSNYKDIKLSTIRIASEVASKKLSFIYDGTDFVPLETEFFPIAYTPTITSASGTLTTVSATGSYVKVGRMVTCFVSIEIINKGTGAGGLQFTLPLTATEIRSGNGFEYNITGWTVGATILSSLTSALIDKYDGTTIIDNSRKVYLTLTYTVA